MNLDDKVMAPTDVANIVVGPIPFIVPFFRRQGRYWAGDEVWRQRNSVLETALNTNSKDEALTTVEKWGNTYYDVPVAVTCFEDLVKLQRESGFMQGIEGVTTDRANIAVNASYIRKAVTNGLFEKSFKVAQSADVNYGFKDAEGSYPGALVQEVVLFPYDGRFMELDGDQFMAIDAKEVNRNTIPQGNLKVEEIIQNNKVLFPYSAIFPEDIAVSLVRRTYQFGSKLYGYDTNMDFYLPRQPAGNNAEMWALYALGLASGPGLVAYTDLGDGDGRLVGVVENPAEGGAKK